MSLTKDELLSPIRWQTKKIAVPEFGTDGHIYVRMMSAGDIGKVHKKIKDGDLSGLSFVFWLCASDEEGQRLFGQGDQQKVDDLPFPAVKRCAEAALELAGLSSEDESDPGKNSQTTPSGSSPSS